MNLNVKVKIRVDANIDSITKTCLFKYNENVYQQKMKIFR